jgi:hypothetical protein
MANADTINNYLAVLTVGNANYQNTTFLMQNVFCPEGGVGPNEVPSVAVTEHGIGVGPAFYGVRKVRKLYNRLFSAFPDVQMLALNAPPLLLASQDGNTIAVQTTLTGTHQDWWFAKADGDKFYSKPLSDIPPNAGVISIPACAVFTFNAQHLVTNLAIYMDRFHFTAQLAP